MKKKILFSSISATLVCFISLLVLSTHSVNAAEGDDKYVAPKSGLNLRSNPDKSSKIITLIPFGAKVTIEKSEGDEIFLDGRYGKWVNVKYDNKTGWVFGGFLCDFKPDTVIKPVVDYYMNYFKKILDVKDRPHWKYSEVSIKNIMDNYIILNVPNGMYDSGNVVWKYDTRQKTFFEACKEICKEAILYKAELLYLDNDKYPDLVVEQARHLEYADVEILLGSENGFIKIYDTSDCDMNDGYFLSIGRCGDMELAYGGDTMHFLRFNCSNRKFEKYAKSKVTESDGNIVSVDLKNMFIVIKDSKDKTYKFYKHYPSVAFKYLKELQNGDKVSFSYVTIDGKKTIISIGKN
ncbi:MAG: SH3 domain-containing protein [Spirochaetes bacterium]|nr:SH3 domain-containing protein [Spirochaetota bacterium]